MSKIKEISRFTVNHAGTLHKNSIHCIVVLLKTMFSNIIHIYTLTKVIIIIVSAHTSFPPEKDKTYRYPHPKRVIIITAIATTTLYMPFGVKYHTMTDRSRF